MASSKQENAMNLDPERFQIAQSMSYMPGAPGAMMNNPMNVTSVSPQKGSLDGINRYPYGDSGIADDPRMGGGVFPMQPSGMPQNMTRGAGLNGQIPYGQQQQPTPSAADSMEAMRLGMDSQQRGLMASGMGPTGTGPMGTLPGGAPPMGQQTAQTIGLQGVQSTDGLAGMQPDDGAMVPGSTPQKIAKKRGKK